MPKFCIRCGTRLESESQECTACSHHTSVSENRSPRYGVTGPLVLYFAILLTNLSGWLAAYAGAEWDQTGIWVTLIDTVIVVAFCIVSHRLILPLLWPLPAWRWLAISAALGVATYGFVTAIAVLCERHLELPFEQPAEELWIAGYGWTVVILLYCVQPAIIEELAFRGFILGALRRILCANEALFVSTLAFMAIHLAVANYPHTFAIGLVAGWLLLRTGSLYPSMVLDFTHNLLCVIFD